MKKVLAVLVMLFFAAALMAQATPAAPATPVKKRPTIRQRQVNQQKRIGQGVNSGQLTARETGKLERQEVRLNKSIAKKRASGGGLTKGERKSIAKQQNTMSRKIYRQKHDAQKRK